MIPIDPRHPNPDRCPTCGAPSVVPERRHAYGCPLEGVTVGREASGVVDDCTCQPHASRSAIKWRSPEHVGLWWKIEAECGCCISVIGNIDIDIVADLCKAHAFADLDAGLTLLRAAEREHAASGKPAVVLGSPSHEGGNET